MASDQGESREAQEPERVEHGEGPKPADRGDTDPIGQPDAVRSGPDVAVDDVGLQRGETELEQRPDQEQATRAYPREEQGTYDPRENIDANTANPSDPRSYGDPVAGTEDIPSRTDPVGTERSPDAVEEQSVADHNNLADTRGPDGIAATGDTERGTVVHDRTTGNEGRTY